MTVVFYLGVTQYKSVEILFFFLYQTVRVCHVLQGVLQCGIRISCLAVHYGGLVKQFLTEFHILAFLGNLLEISSPLRYMPMAS